MPTTTTARVAFDSDPDTTWECSGFLNRTRDGIATSNADRSNWNGWELPLFNREQADALRKSIDATFGADSSETLSWDRGVGSRNGIEELIIRSDGIEVEAPEITVDGERLWWLDGWTWCEA